MKFENYRPYFRQVTLKEIKEEVTLGGIILPETLKNEDPEFTVVKAGKDCIEVKAGDTIKLTRGTFLDRFRLVMPDDTIEEFVQVMEQQIIGGERVQAASSMDDFNDDSAPVEEFDSEQWVKQPLTISPKVVGGVTEEMLELDYKPRE